MTSPHRPKWMPPSGRSARLFGRALLRLLVAFVPAYAIYVFWLQLPGVVSFSRLGLAGAAWAVLFSVSWFIPAGALARLWQDPTSRLGIGAAFLLLNLAAAAYISRVPYTAALLPGQRLAVQPLSAGRPIELISLVTESGGWQDFSQFQQTAGWRLEDGRISSMDGEDRALVWEGKPGQFATVQFLACPGCGQARIDFGDGQPQVVDLGGATSGQPLTLRHEFAPLLFHKILNAAALEAALFLAAVTMGLAAGWLAGRARRFEQSSHPSGLSRMKGAPYLALGLLTVSVFALKLQPVLFNDDWCQVVSYLNTNLVQPFMLNERRPLNLFFPWLFDQFLPLESAVMALYVSQLIFLYLTAVLMYILIRQALPGREAFALLGAALWLVFPNDYTRLYITMEGIRLANLLTVAALVLVTRAIRQEQWIAGWGAGILLAASFLIYEGQLGLALLWPLLIVILLKRRLTNRQVLGLSGYLLAIFLFLVWRLAVQPQVYTDTKLGSISLDAGTILNRFVGALPTVLGGFQLPYPEINWASPQNLAALLALAGSLAALWLVTRRLPMYLNGKAALASALRSDLAICAGGLALWAAGYFPILLNYAPNIYGHLSRVNLFSIPGAVLVLLGLADLMLLGLFQNPRLVSRVMVLAGLVWVGFGSLVLIQVHQSYNDTWQKTKAFYSALFQKVPALQEDTHVLLVLDGFQAKNSNRRPIFTSGWEAACALQTLYGRPGLAVDYRYTDLAAPPFPAMNILGGALETDTGIQIGDPARLLGLEYDDTSGSVSILTDVNGWVGQDLAGRYEPFKRILPQGVPTAARALIR